jgi:hypothetical protein
MKPRVWLGGLAGVLALAILAMGWGGLAAGGRPAAQPAHSVPTPNPPRLPTRPEAQAPALSAIDAPSPTCYCPARNTGRCYIEWQYFYVTAAASQYVISMTVAIDGQVRAYHGGFFQTAMYVPSDFYGDGFGVSCGRPTAEGLGNTYDFLIQARETGGGAMETRGTVTCPADVALLYVPLLRRD